MTDTRPAYPHEEFDDPKLRELVEIAFFASLGKEEGNPTRARIVYHSAGIGRLRRVADIIEVAGGTMKRAAWNILALEARDGATELTVETLRKIAPAVDLPRGFVVVGCNNDDRLVIQGVAHRLEYPYYNPEGEDGLVFIDTPRVGCITVTRNGGSTFYEDGAWTRRVWLDQLIFEERSVVRKALAQLCRRLMAEFSEGIGGGQEVIVFRTVSDLVRTMANSSHGGILLFGEGADALAGKYQVAETDRPVLAHNVKKYVELSTQSFALMLHDAQTDDDKLEESVTESDYQTAQESLDSVVRGVAQLTVVDNALVIGADLSVVCAGYKIPTTFSPSIREWTTIDTTGPSRPYPLDKHGSRHHSAATFAAIAPGNLAFVVSQDGSLRCFHRPLGQAGNEVAVWQLRIRDQ